MTEKSPLSTSMPPAAMDAIAHGALASSELSAAARNIMVGGLDRAEERLGNARDALATFHLAFHLMEAKLAAHQGQFGAAVEATLAARNCFNRLPAEKREAYLEALRAAEEETGACYRP